ncbi:MAG: M24 family metallopeptidase [Candidatus Magasanikbacteria bacterium]|nr:M24 family metallopeptidase [Candidatus Magasanikbacteria bacterium]
MLIKSPRDLKNIKRSGALLGQILATLVKRCTPGVSTWELDQLAETLVREAGGRPAFKGYETVHASYPFPATLCVSLNEELVHGIPRHSRVLKSGDLVSLDIGMEWPYQGKRRKLALSKAEGGKGKSDGGVFTDTAITVSVGKAKPAVSKLMAVTRAALAEGIKAAQPGNSVAAIGKAVETYVKAQGNYGIIRDLVGHGVGHAVHEEPYIPNYYDRALEGIILKPGMVIAIEPMISLGGLAVATLPDGWTIKTADHSLCAHFEHTVIITEQGNVVATRRPDESKL